MSVAPLVPRTQLCPGSPAFQRALYKGRWAAPTERETARHCLPSAWWAEPGMAALATEEGRSWVEASRTFLVTAGLTKGALFTPCSYTCPLKGGGQRTTESGSPARDQGESWELATGKRNPGAPSASQAKAKDVEKVELCP